jgi:hypothetical protein
MSFTSCAQVRCNEGNQRPKGLRVTALLGGYRDTRADKLAFGASPPSMARPCGGVSKLVVHRRASRSRLSEACEEIEARDRRLAAIEKNASANRQ